MPKKGEKWEDISKHWSRNPEMRAITLEKISKTKTGGTQSAASNKKRSETMKGKRPKNLQMMLDIAHALRRKTRICKGCGVSFIRRNTVYHSVKCYQAHWKPDISGFKPKYGPDNHNWKGGKSTENHKRREEPRYKEWRSAVFERDNYICQDCGARGDVEAHHIMPFLTHAALRYEVSNGKTLCKKCHKKPGLHLGIPHTNRPMKFRVGKLVRSR